MNPKLPGIQRTRKPSTCMGKDIDVHMTELLELFDKECKS